jgi:hypothetical protein
MSFVGDHIADCPTSKDDEQVCSDFAYHQNCHCTGMVQSCEGLKQLLHFHDATKMLLLGRNVLQKVPPAVQTLKRLIFLDLSNNKISALKRGDLNALEHLKFLLLRNNQIQTVEIGTFLGNKELQYLDLSLNPIQEIVYGSFLGLQSLEALNLSFCEI